MDAVIVLPSARSEQIFLNARPRKAILPTNIIAKIFRNATEAAAAMSLYFLKNFR